MNTVLTTSLLFSGFSIPKLVSSNNSQFSGLCVGLRVQDRLIMSEMPLLPLDLMQLTCYSICGAYIFPLSILWTLLYLLLASNVMSESNVNFLFYDDFFFLPALQKNYAFKFNNLNRICWCGPFSTFFLECQVPFFFCKFSPLLKKIFLLYP